MKPDRKPDSLCGTWQDSEADRLMREEELEAEEKLKGELAQAGAAAAEDLKSQLAARMKDKGDAFDTMIQSEEKIRLGEEGWKARYYQVACPFDRLSVWHRVIIFSQESCRLVHGRWTLLIPRSRCLPSALCSPVGTVKTERLGASG